MDQMTELPIAERVTTLEEAVTDLQVAMSVNIDDEIAALEVAYKAMRGLDIVTSRRACEWLRQRLEDEAMKTAEPSE